MNDRYEPPVDRFLTLGEADLRRKQWADYRAMGITPAHVPELIRMVRDDALHDASMDTALVWAPVHAWRALGQLGAEEAALPLLEVLEKRYDDDFALEEIPEALGRVGPAALEPAAALLERADAAPYLRVAAARAVAEVGRGHPAHREAAAAILARQLEQWDAQDGDLNAFLVSYLTDLRAVDAAPVIKAAFDAGAVSTGVCGGWNDIGAELGLRTGPQAPAFVSPAPARVAGERKAGDGARAAAKRKAQKAARRKRR